MNEVLRQKKFSITKKEFRLTETGVSINERKDQKEWEYTVPYEKIGFETVVKKDLANSKAFWMVAILFVFCLAGIVMLFVHPPEEKDKLMYVVVPGFAVMMGFLTIKGWLQRNLVYEYLTGGEKTIEFLKDEPNEAEYYRFKSALYDRIKAVYRKRLLYDADMNAS